MDENVIFLAIRSSQFTVNTCGNRYYNLLTHRCVATLFFKAEITSGFCSLVAIKVTYVVSSGKKFNIFITV